ncbi:MAG: SGNH/GDSL hydrolase family protein [Flavisolibacter sp.]
MHLYSYLALGDSYTIGESVPLQKSFPYQLVQKLRDKEYNFQAPEIIARTGWTIEELEEGMKNYRLLPRYDFVSLLIGVNNQFRGQEVIQYKQLLEELLKKCIEAANGKKDHVLLLSIPDYSFTPYAGKLDTEKIGREIEVFNSVGKALSIQYKIQHVDISEEWNVARNNPELIAADGLHPSEKLYQKWAKKLAELIITQLK